MRGTSRGVRRGEGGFKVLVSLTILFIAGVAAFKIVPLHLQGNDLTDAMDEAANFAGIKGLDKLKYEIIKRAQKNGIMLTDKDLKVERRGPNVYINAKYEKTVDILGYQYTYKYDKVVEKQIF